MMLNALFSQLSNNLDLSKLVILGLKAMFGSLLAFCVWLVVFYQADKIAETFLDDYFWVLIIGFVVCGLYSVIAQKRS